MMRSRPVCLGLGGLITWAGITTTATAQVQSAASLPPQEQVIFEQLLEIPSVYELGFGFVGEVSDEWPIVTNEDASLYTPALPSFWMSREHLPTLWRTAENLPPLRVDSYRLVREWTAFHSQTAELPVVDFQVDPQYWNQLNYYQKYGVLRRLGTTGMGYGYHVRIWSSISLAAVYACDFSGYPRLGTNLEQPIEIPDLNGVDCTASLGPFVDYSSPDFNDLFAPP